jgi:hypothetical protein
VTFLGVRLTASGGGASSRCIIITADCVPLKGVLPDSNRYAITPRL